MAVDPKRPLADWLLRAQDYDRRANEADTEADTMVREKFDAVEVNLRAIARSFREAATDIRKWVKKEMNK